MAAAAEGMKYLLRSAEKTTLRGTANERSGGGRAWKPDLHAWNHEPDYSRSCLAGKSLRRPGAQMGALRQSGLPKQTMRQGVKCLTVFGVLR